MAIVAVVVLNILARYAYARFDLTEDKRYTLSQPAVDVAQKFDSPVIIDILLDGNIPPEFSRLKTETVQLLESFASKNANIKYNLVDPLEDEERAQQTIAELQAWAIEQSCCLLGERRGCCYARRRSLG